MYNKSKNTYLDDYFAKDNHSPVVVELHGFIPAFNDASKSSSKKDSKSVQDPLGLFKRVQTFKTSTDYILEDKDFTDIESIAYVQDFVTSISWSNSIAPPYQTGSLNMKMPIDAAIHYFQGRYIIPNYSNSRINAGRRTDYRQDVGTTTANINSDDQGNYKSNIDKIKADIKDKVINKDGIINPFGRQPSAGGWIVIRSESVTRDDSTEVITQGISSDPDIDKLKAERNNLNTKSKELQTELTKINKDIRLLEENNADGNRTDTVLINKLKSRKALIEKALADNQSEQQNADDQLQDISTKLNVVKHPAVFFGKIVNVSISLESMAYDNGTKSYANITIHYEGFLNPLMNCDFVVSISQGAGAAGLKKGTIFQGVDKQGQSDFINEYLKYFLEQSKKRNVKAGDVLQSMINLFGQMELPQTLLTPLTSDYADSQLKQLKNNEIKRSVLESKDASKEQLEELRDKNQSYYLNSIPNNFKMQLGDVITVIDGNDKSYGSPYTGCFLKTSKMNVEGPVDNKRNTSKNSAPVFFGTDAFSTAINGMKGKRIWSLLESLGKPDSNVVEMFPVLLPLSSLPANDAIDQFRILFGDDINYSNLQNNDLNSTRLMLFKTLGAIPAIIYRFKPVSYTAVTKSAFDRLYNERIWRKGYLRNKTYSEQIGMSEDMELKDNPFGQMDNASNVHVGPNSRIIDAKYIHSVSLKSNDSRINCVYTRPAVSGKFADGFELLGALSDPMIDPYSINRYGLSIYETYYPFFNFDNNNAAVEETKLDKQDDGTVEILSEDGKNLIRIKPDGTEEVVPLDQSGYAVNTIKAPVIFNEAGEINEDEIKAGFASQWVVYPNDKAALVSSDGSITTYKRTRDIDNVVTIFQQNESGTPDSIVVDPFIISEVNRVLDERKQQELDVKAKKYNAQADTKGWTPNANALEKGLVKDSYVLSSAISERVFLNLASDCNYYRGTIATYYNPIVEHVPGTHMAFQFGEWYASLGEEAEPFTNNFNTKLRDELEDKAAETNYGPYPEANNIFLLCYVEAITHKIVTNPNTGSKTSMTIYEFSRGTIVSGINNMGEPYQGGNLLAQLASKVEVPYMTPYSVNEGE